MSLSKMSTRSLCTAAIALTLAASANAEITDFGGHTERFKGGGDKIPPQCSINVPKASQEPFTIKWYCIDDNAGSQDIRTELWMFRKDSPASELVGNFLGFPAAAYIDEKTLHTATVAEGLPVRFRLLAKDRAGITTVSPVITVGATDTSLDTCTLEVNTEGTESTGDTTGVPAASVRATNVPVEVTESGENQITIKSAEPAGATPCELDSFCSDDSEVSFELTLTLDEAAESQTGTITINPAGQSVELSGEAKVEGIKLSSISLTGETTVETVPATVSLNCSQ
ncbi:MAG: hypothetical protein IT290_06215 [Deltaproteobacteria bacterium]|nr:hypothetical protein [Deltaproteobacteria bacterium]